MRDVSQRSAFLIDRDGVIRGAWGYDTGELPDFDELLPAAPFLVASASSQHGPDNESVNSPARPPGRGQELVSE